MYLWEGISEFVAVAESESFTAGSKRLGISTAQVSRQVGKLEDRLNTKLFYRTTRKVSLTDEGRTYYQHCRQVIDGLEEAERAMGQLRDTPQGMITMTAPVTYGEHFIMPLVHDFMLTYPEVEVKMRLTNRTVDLVEGGIDLAIRLGNLDSSTMMAKRLASRTMYVCASPDYLAKHGTPDSLDALSQHNCLRGNYEHWRFRDGQQEKALRIKGNLTCNSGYGLRDAARKGIGLVQLPDYYVAGDIAAGRLQTVLDDYRVADEGIWALYPHNRHLSLKVRMLVDHLANALA